ncbi:hypothetical protein [Runella sp.]|uniref:hypothetical protein n=1 Tax=Runella sp. TaxID=1960881 RepID=UPI003D0F0900
MEQFKIVEPPHLYPMEIVGDIDETLSEGEGTAFEYVDAKIFILKVVIEGISRQWMSRDEKKRAKLVKYFVQLKKLMPMLKVECWLAEIEGKQVEPVFADLNGSTVYTD